MTKVISMTLDPASINAAASELKEYIKWVKDKTSQLAEKLADIGVVNVSLAFARAFYTGPIDVEVTVQERGENKYAIVAGGETVLILEFGAGVTYGYGHPMADEMGYGPGTYPGQKHAMTGKGWWIPNSKGGGHTYGNPPTMAMYQTAKDLRNDIERIAREVFNS